jgi:hypothetical protein
MGAGEKEPAVTRPQTGCQVWATGRRGNGDMGAGREGAALRERRSSSQAKPTAPCQTPARRRTRPSCEPRPRCKAADEPHARESAGGSRSHKRRPICTVARTLGRRYEPRTPERALTVGPEPRTPGKSATDLSVGVQPRAAEEQHARAPRTPTTRVASSNTDAARIGSGNGAFWGQISSEIRIFGRRGPPAAAVRRVTASSGGSGESGSRGGRLLAVAARSPRGRLRATQRRLASKQFLICLYRLSL